ncbi:CRISPR-associated ring nuclease Csm6 [Actinobacillus genomosp. 1]|uniref:CRISPR-associated ring nuclease Csm6 n=1 Tax=Actinobacillus genomosp. 1 TaxID=254839 RepID=UPI0024417C75|nr:CRISPR-associated ring nuclease Csm6 [Actinobacillus genomosp. 1]WGE91142.1 CRISPR-associated ring nuclease Csm6 [Actinobacillus genomosp. 1]
MKTYNKRILLSVTGMSPAVVTETLYALVTEKNFIPTEIQVITTIQGKNKLLSALLGIEGGRKERKGALQEFIDDYGSHYGFTQIHFDESCIHIIEDTSGEKLPDIRTPQENEFAADNIVKLVGTLCQDEESQLHVSIAGGRKTMGFFMGYALSLYGREQDSLSHVLVDEQFETLPNFYYRKPQQHLIINRDGKELDASQANIMLAEIPWVRLGLGVPEDLKDNKVSYSQSVKNAQELLKEPKLTFLYEIELRQVQFGTSEVQLSPRGYAFLLSLVISRIKGKKFDINDPKVLSELTEIYAKIYTYLASSSIEILPDTKIIKTAEDLISEFNSAYSRFSDMIRDSRTSISNDVKKAFSIGKGGKSRYIPYSKNYCYHLDVEDVDISEIEPELKRLNLL